MTSHHVEYHSDEAGLRPAIGVIVLEAAHDSQRKTFLTTEALDHPFTASLSQRYCLAIGAAEQWILLHL